LITNLPHDEQKVRYIPARDLALPQHVEIAGDRDGVNPHQDALVQWEGPNAASLLGYLHDQLLIKCRLRGVAEGTILRVGPPIRIIVRRLENQDFDPEIYVFPGILFLQ